MTDTNMTDRDHPGPIDWRAYRFFIGCARMFREGGPTGDRLRKHGVADMTREDLKLVSRCNHICRDVQAEERERLGHLSALFERYAANDVPELARLVPASDLTGRMILADYLDLDAEAGEAARRLGKRYEGILVDSIEGDPDDDPNFWVAALRAGLLGLR